MAGEERKPPMQQVREILGFMAEGLVTGTVPEKVQEGIVNEAAKFLGERKPACPRCGGALDEVETAGGVTVQICAAACAKGAAKR